MPTTLRVKNESDGDVVVKLDDDSESFDIKAGKEADLEEKFLQTQSFANLLNAGTLRFLFTPLRSSEQANLARQLMPRILRVKNESAAIVTLELDNQSESLDIAVGTEADLETKWLLTRSFLTFLQEGKLSFVRIESPNNEQYKLARQLMPRLLSKIGSSFIQLNSRAEAGVQTMQNHRDNYNKSWTAAEKILQLGKDNSSATDLLSQGIDHFLNVAPEQALVDQIKQEITDLEEEDLDATGRDLADWYVERDQKQDELEKAEAILAKAQQEYQQRYEGLIKKLKEAADNLKNIDSGQDIGQKLATDW